MDKKYIEQAAKQHADFFYKEDEEGILYKSTINDFTAGVEWLLSIQEEIEATKK